MKKISTSVIIPTKGRTDLVCRCMNSILKQTLLPDEIIIIDASKKPLLCKILKEKVSKASIPIKYVHSNVSLTAARNIGVKESSGDVIFFFDDDVVLDRNYIKEVVKIFIQDKEGKIGGVMGNITNVYRNTESLRNKLRRLLFLSYFGNGKTLRSGLTSSVQGIKNITKTDFLSGCASAYRREVFRHFKFDEELNKISGYCFMEDMDFSYRVSRKYTLLYVPSAKLKHLKSSFSRIDIILANRQFIYNRFYLFRKNTPKHLLNCIAFWISIFGLILITLFRRNPKTLIGIMFGFKDVLCKP